MKNRLGLLLIPFGILLMLFVAYITIRENVLSEMLVAIGFLCILVGILLMCKSKIGPIKDALDPYEYNTVLFDKFYHDLNNNKLPKIPNPTKAEIREYIRRKNESLKKEESSSDSVDMSKLLENNSIPVEVDIWVDKVYDYYFRSLEPMLGMVHWCEGARKALYRHKGYTWHTISELYPYIIFD